MNFRTRRVASVIGGSTAALVALSGVAIAFWSASDDGVGRGKAGTAGTGGAPNVSVNGPDVSLTWPPTPDATGYTIKRYGSPSGGSPTSAGTGSCAGTVTGTSCSETGVPAGSWYYTVTPRRYLWVGDESARSNAASSVASALTLTGNPQAAGGTVTGALTGFRANETVTFRIATTSGTQLVTVPAPVTTNASGAASGVTITVPTGTAGASRTVHAMGSLTSAASASFTYATPVGPSPAGYTVTFSPAAPTAGSAANVTITAKNSLGATDLTYTGSKTLNWTGTAATNSPNGTAATLPTTAWNFAGGTVTRSITLTKAGTGLELRATDAAVAVRTGTATVTVNPGGNSNLNWVTQPTTRAVNVVFATSPSVEIRDNLGNRTASNANVQIAKNTGPGNLNCTGGLQKAASSGLATFAGCSLDTVGTVTLKASNIGSDVPSSSFVINPLPTITSPSNSSRAQLSRTTPSSNKSIAVNGTGFQSGATASFSSATGISNVSVTYTSATSLTVTFTLAADAPTGSRPVTITNPDGGVVTSQSNSIIVNN